jgi:hypothetical protein
VLDRPSSYGLTPQDSPAKIMGSKSERPKISTRLQGNKLLVKVEFSGVGRGQCLER